MQAQAQEIKWEIEQLDMSKKKRELSSIIDAAHKTKSVSQTDMIVDMINILIILSTIR